MQKERESMGRRLKVPMVLVAVLFTALATAAALSSATVSFQSAERDGARVAEVLIGDTVVMVLRTSAGGYSPVERAEIVANRLRSAMGEEMEAREVAVYPVTSGQGVYVGKQLIVAVYQTEADAHKATPTALAEMWRDNIIRAAGLEVAEPPADAKPPMEEAPPADGKPPAEELPAEEPVEATGEATPEAEPAIDWTGTAQKWVPIFSLETEGAYVGAAQIAGPPSQVDQVRGVAELRLNFRNLGRIYAYVPVRTISTNLDRVQGVSVWATGDVQLVDF